MNKRKWSRIITFAIAAVVLITGVIVANAAPEKTRGRVVVDLDTFQYAGHSGGAAHGFSKKDDGYYLYYTNHLISDHDKDGVTYRSKNKFSMIDVTGVELMAYTQTNDPDHKFMIYTTSSEDKTFHGWSRKNINSSMYENQNPAVNGIVDTFDKYATPIAGGIYAETYKHRSFNSDKSYEDRYVYVGMAHGTSWSKTGIMLQNSTYTMTESGKVESGSIALKLKEHKVNLLTPDDVKVLQEDGTYETVPGITNLRLGTEGFQSNNREGVVYRDEDITITYSIVNQCRLTGYKFYSDKAKSNLLYTMNVAEAPNQTTFSFDGNLIKKLEEKTGKFNLGDVYIEPVVERIPVTFDFSKAVDGKDGLEVVQDPDNKNKYILRESNYTHKKIGTFTKNDAQYLGDAFSLDYEPDESYDGETAFTAYQFRECEASNQVNTTAPAIAYYNRELPDIETKYTEKYFWVRAQVSKKMTVFLYDDWNNYTSKPQNIYPAIVTYGGAVQDIDDSNIRYDYYTAPECTEKSRLEENPINAGEYYCIATVKADPEKGTAASSSNIAKFSIYKSWPELSEIKAEKSIMCGQSVKEAGEITGKAKGVTGSDVPGTFTLVDDTVKPGLGTYEAEVIFEPNEQYAINYENATGTCKITVEQAKPTITMTDKTAVYTGEPVEMDTAKVTGIDGKDTGQKIRYEYYKSRVGDKLVGELNGAPTNAGTYYVLAKADMMDDYAFVKTEEKDAATLTITKRQAELIQAQVGEKYRVYVTNLASKLPNGTIDIDVSVDGNIKASIDSLSINKDGYAECDYSDITSALGEGSQICDITAVYNHVNNDNYEIKPNTVEVEISDGEIIIKEEAELTITYGTTYSSDNEANSLDIEEAIFGDEGAPEGTSYKWKFPENDVARFSTLNDGRTLCADSINAGTTSVLVYVNIPESGESELKSFYATVRCNVKKCYADIHVYPTPAKYVGASPGYQIGYYDFVDFGWKLRYTKDAEFVFEQNGTVMDGEPADVGVYHVKATLPESRNFYETTEENDVEILPANAVAIPENKTVVYNGKPQTIDPPKLQGVTGGSPVTGEVTYSYEGIKGTEYPKTDKPPVDAGVYRVHVNLAADGNYYGYYSQAILTIEKANCIVEVINKDVTYSGEAVNAEAVVKCGDEEIEGVDVSFMYRSVADTVEQMTSEPPVDAGMYYVAASVAGNNNFTDAYSKEGTITIRPADMKVTIDDATAEYTGEERSAQELGCEVKVTGLNGAPIEVEDIEYSYFKDKEGTVQLSYLPEDAGAYYVQASAVAPRNYKAGKSNIAAITITKVTPEISVELGEITYGQECSEAKITGTATGVNGVTVEGGFAITNQMAHEKCDAGTVEVTVNFSPAGDDSVNYNNISTKADLKIAKYQPEIIGSGKAALYNGQQITIDEPKAAGAQGMPLPGGQISCTYFADQEMTVKAEDTVNAGTYYVKAELAEEDNYLGTSETYKLEISPAKAQIEMAVTGKNTLENTVDLKGTIPGIFDDPTGSITIYKKAAGGEYEKAAESIAIAVDANGFYCFEAGDVRLGTKGTYSLKAVYVHGDKKNYEVAETELEDVNSIKELQKIEFDPRVYNKTYGDDDFDVTAKAEGEGTNSEIKYRLIKKAGNPDAVEISQDGNVEIKSTGTAYCLAYKTGNDEYYPAIAFAEINIAKAPVQVSAEGEIKVYDGSPAEVKVSITSSGNALDEEVDLTYKFESETGEVSEEAPVNAGKYTVTVQSSEGKNYAMSEPSEPAEIIIEKAVPKVTVNATDITYGQALSDSEINGRAVDAEGREIPGNFVMDSETAAEKRDAGTHKIPLIFEPEGEFAINYSSVTEDVKIRVQKYQPEIIGASKTAVYNGQKIALGQTEVKGAQGMPAPENEVTYTYYSDENKLFKVKEPVDAGIYYVKAELSEEKNYLSASEEYTLEILPAEAKIQLSATGDDKVNIEGILEGVIDDPTGNVTVYIKDAGTDDSAYEELVSNIPITEESGLYGFEAEAENIEAGVYDFKAVYLPGEKNNYIISDGIAEDIEFVDKNDEDVVPGEDDKNKENKDDINKPGTKTGDDSNTFILLMLMILSLAGAGAVLATRKSV